MLASVDSREVCKCDGCGLTQFVPASGISSPCRRCHVPLDFAPGLPTPEAPAPAHHWTASAPSAQLPATVKILRLRLGLSQRDLGAIMSVPRTYVSKIENDKATPNLPGLERLARGLQVTVSELLAGPDRNRQAQVRELVSDAFIAELMPFASRLSQTQRRMILAEMSNLSLRSRPRAAAA